MVVSDHVCASSDPSHALDLQTITALEAENERLLAVLQEQVREATHIISIVAKRGYIPTNAPLIIAVEDWLDEHIEGDD